MGIYTNTSAFRRALLTSDIYSENLRETLRAAEIQKQMQEEAENRQSNSFLGKLAGGALGFFIGGPAGAKIGANVGSTAGMNFDNTDYGSFIGNNPAQFMGKFNIAEGMQGYQALKDSAQDMEDQQDSMNKMAVFKLAFDVLTTNFSDSLNMNKEIIDPKSGKVTGMQDNWYEMNLKEKMNHFKNYKTDFKMQDFLKGLKSATNAGDVINSMVDSGIPDEIADASGSTVFEEAFTKNMTNALEQDINKILSSVDNSVGLGGATVDDLNNSLLELGHGPISSDLFDIITVDDTNTFPENFNWGVFK